MEAQPFLSVALTPSYVYFRLLNNWGKPNLHSNSPGGGVSMQMGRRFSVQFLFSVLISILLSLCSGCQRASIASSIKPSVSVLEMEPIPKTPERRARGKYLVEGLLQCPFCHSDYDFTKR